VSAERHEAAHAACAIMLDRRVDHVLVEPGHAWVGEQLGQARIPVADRIEPSQVVLCLVGYMSEDTPGWPPSFEDALDEDREALGTVLLRLGANERAYKASVELAHAILADPDFQRLARAIERVLHRVPHLDAADIEALAAIHLPDKEQLCST
jgi:hypothetical protein